MIIGGILIVAILLIIAGSLIYRKNSTKIETDVADAKNVVADVSEAVDEIKKS